MKTRMGEAAVPNAKRQRARQPHLLYLDYNCYQRSFDDPSQIRIQMEAMSCEKILAEAEKGNVRLVWSFMHDDETLVCPFVERRCEVLRLASLSTVRVAANEPIYEKAQGYQQTMGVSSKDAVHLACAYFAKADFILTCDDKLVNLVSRFSLEIVVLNPVDYVRRWVD